MTITTAYWCVLIAAILPYVWVGIAKARGERYDNRQPRAWLAKQADPFVQRATAAQFNAFEAFPAFAAGVALARLAEVAEPTVAMLAVVFVVARVLHGAFYLTDRPLLRSLSWFVAIGGTFGLLGSAAAAAGQT